MTDAIEYSPACTRSLRSNPNRDGVVLLDFTVGQVEDIFALLDAYRTLIFSGKRCPADFKFPEASHIFHVCDELNKSIKRGNARIEQINAEASDTQN